MGLLRPAYIYYHNLHFTSTNETHYGRYLLDGKDSGSIILFTITTTRVDLGRGPLRPAYIFYHNLTFTSTNETHYVRYFLDGKDSGSNARRC